MCAKGCLDFHALCWSPPHGGASEHHRVAGPLPEAAPLVDGAYGHRPQGHRRPAGVRAEAVVAATVHVLAIPASPVARGGRWTVDKDGSDQSTPAKLVDAGFLVSDQFQGKNMFDLLF